MSGERLIVVRGVVRQHHDGWWLEIVADEVREPWRDVGPFPTRAEAVRAADDFSKLLRSVGAIDPRGRA
jgi:hypothetical protein